MALTIMDDSLVLYALEYALCTPSDDERSNWICNRIQENIHQLNQATLEHILQKINGDVQESWGYLESAPFKRLRTYVVNELEIYK